MGRWEMCIKHHGKISEDIVKMDLREISCEDMGRNELAQDRVHFQVFMYMVMKLIIR
jgi:hypothetical protein